MESAPDRRAIVVCDACVLINFLVVDRMDLLTRHLDYRFVVTEHAKAEVTDPVQHERLLTVIESRELEQADLTDPESLAVFAKLSAVLGGGEAAAIALAAERNWAIATDELGRTFREVESRLGEGRLLTTPGILLQAIRNGALPVEEADEIKARLEAHRFKMNFASFADLLGGN